MVLNFEKPGLVEATKVKQKHDNEAHSPSIAYYSEGFRVAGEPELYLSAYHPHTPNRMILHNHTLRVQVVLIYGF